MPIDPNRTKWLHDQLKTWGVIAGNAEVRKEGPTKDRPYTEHYGVAMFLNEALILHDFEVSILLRDDKEALIDNQIHHIIASALRGRLSAPESDGDDATE